MIIKVSTSIFSRIKTVDRALQKAMHGDEIFLTDGKYIEDIIINKHVKLIAKMTASVFLEGVFIIPKDTHVTFENLTIHPTTQLYVEGKITLINCSLIGATTNVLLSINEGQAVIEKCRFSGASDIGIALLQNSHAVIENCYFE